MNVTEQKSVSEVRLLDPLSKVTRKERRNLLIANSLGFVMIKVGVIPTKISALGIEFSLSDQRALLAFTALLIGYFLISFLLYSATDLIAWRIAISRTRLNILKISELHTGVDEAEVREIRRRLMRWALSSRPVSFIRAILDFGFPIVYAGYVVWILLF